MIRRRSLIWENKPTALDLKSLNRFLLMQHWIPTVSCYLTWSRAHLRNFLFALKTFQARTGWFTLPRSGGNVCSFATCSPNAQSSLQSSPKVTRDIMKTADNDLIMWIYECCHNLLRENISVSSSQKSQPKRHKKAFRNVAKKKVSLKRKRKIIQNRWSSCTFVISCCCSYFELAWSMDNVQKMVIVKPRVFEVMKQR